MKVLIWIGTLFVLPVVKGILQDVIDLGFSWPILDAILFLGVECFVADKLCKKWTEKKADKKSVSRVMAMAGEKKEPDPDEWKCSCGRINKDYVSSCVCGNTKQMAAAKSAADGT